jgi:aerobic C4-dicarboxylate transport protein
LWFWVLIAIVAGIVFGFLFEDAALKAKWLADAFIKVITGPVIFVTVVIGIAGLGKVAKAGGIAIRALAYFFCATVVALALGLAAGNIVKPGDGFDAKPTSEQQADAKESIGEAGDQGVVAFITDDLLPSSVAEPFVENAILQVLVLAILTAIAVSGLPERDRERVVGVFEVLSRIIFGVIRLIMWAAPIGAFGGMAYLTLGALFITQAAGQDLAIGEQLALAALMILTSKGAAGITGAGLVTLTASLQAFGGEFFTPESIAVGIALVVGIDRIMSEGRALTNAIGNSVATLVVAKWCGELDEERLKEALDEPAELDRATERALAGAAA